MNYIEKALAMIAPSAFYEINPENVSILVKAFKAAIEQHEAFRREVSDAVEEYKADQPHIWQQSASGYLSRFIIFAPKPDPLEEIIGELDDGTWGETKAEYADRLRAALDALGFEIREKNDDQNFNTCNRMR